MTDQPGSGSDPERGGGGSESEGGSQPPPVPPLFPGQYGGGGGYGGPPGVQVPRGYEPQPYQGQQPPPYQGQPGQPPYSGQPGQPPYPGQPGGPGQPPYPPPPAYGSPDPNAYLGAPAYPGYPGMEDPNARRRFSGFAIAAFITGLVVPIIGIFAAVPLGIIALVKIPKTHAKGTWMAITGMVLSVLWWGGLIAVGVWAVNNQAQRNDAGVIDKSGDIGFSDIRVGDCINIGGLSGNGSINALQGVPCANKHNAQAYAIVTLTGDSYPGEAAVAQQARASCQPKFTPYAAPGRRPYFLYPTEGVWGDAGGHRAVCFVIPLENQLTTGSVVN